MSKNADCVAIHCIWNDKLKKGLCIGFSKNTRSYSKDVCRLCYLEGSKPVPNKPCPPRKIGAQMTPQEALETGAALIQCSGYGEYLLQRLKQSPEVSENETKEVEK